MTSPSEPGIHSEPKIAGSVNIDLRLPQQLRCGPRHPVATARTTAVILAKRNTPFYWWKINGVHMGVRRRPLEQPLQPSSWCTGGGTSPCRTSPNVTASLGNSAFGQKFPVLATEIPCFRMKQGIAYKRLNSLCDRPPNPRQEASIGLNFQKFPVIFPVLRECADQAVSRFRHPSPIPTID